MNWICRSHRFFMRVPRLVIGFRSSLGESVCWMNKRETSSCTAGIFHFVCNIESFIRFISRLVLNESAPGHSARAVQVLMGNWNTPQVPVCGDKLPPCETKWRWCSHSLLPLLQTAIVLLIILPFNGVQPPSLILSEVIIEAGGRAFPVLMWRSVDWPFSSIRGKKFLPEQTECWSL